jgi:hypothetical protein
VWQVGRSIGHGRRRGRCRRFCRRFELDQVGQPRTLPRWKTSSSAHRKDSGISDGRTSAKRESVYEPRQRSRLKFSRRRRRRNHSVRRSWTSSNATLQATVRPARQAQTRPVLLRLPSLPSPVQHDWTPLQTPARKLPLIQRRGELFSRRGSLG